MPYVVGVAGGSASGKTSFLKALKAKFEPGQVAVISLDNYYFDKHLQVVDDEGNINFDLPEAVDRAALLRDLRLLVAGTGVQRKEYTFNNDAATASMVKVMPAPVIIIEGLFVFHFTELASLLDLKVYIDARDEIMLQRRLRRDALERGYPESDVRYRWEKHVKPCYQNYLAPYRDHCDVIITNNQVFDKGLEVIASHLRTKV